jgi:hypothetical protein
MAQTSKLGQRNIALSACGFALDAIEFEKKLIEYVVMFKYTFKKDT